jgi:flavorubredoxin
MSLNLPIEVISPSHGVIWRDNPMQIVEKYSQWAKDYQKNQITIIYDTMWNGTKKLAEKIAAGIVAADSQVEVKIFNLAKSDFNDLTTEIFKSKTVVMGSPTMGNSVLHSVAGFINYVKSMKFKNKKAAAFGCFGWSGESVKIINQLMQEAGFEVINEGLRNQWNPDEKAKKVAIKFGNEIAKA